LRIPSQYTVWERRLILLQEKGPKFSGTLFFLQWYERKMNDSLLYLGNILGRDKHKSSAGNGALDPPKVRKEGKSRCMKNGTMMPLIRPSKTSFLPRYREQAKKKKKKCLRWA
jgi:hypothetical protein